MRIALKVAFGEMRDGSSRCRRKLRSGSQKGDFDGRTSSWTTFGYRPQSGERISNRASIRRPARALRIVSVCLLVLPVVGLFTGYYREMGAVGVYQAVMYFVGFLGLRALARKREAGREINR